MEEKLSLYKVKIVGDPDWYYVSTTDPIKIYEHDWSNIVKIIKLIESHYVLK